MNKFTLTIDGILVEANSSMTVLQAAKNSGIFIPTMCAHDELDPYGACRLCVVEIDGVRGTPTSCTTPAAAGMVVRTNTEQLNEQRQRTLELLFSSHPSPCLSCDSRIDCENVKSTPTKASTATRCGTCSNRPECGLRGVALGSYEKKLDLPLIYDTNKIDKSDPFIDKDFNLCVLCGICVRVCEKTHDKPAIAISNRGKFAKVTSAFDKPWSQDECMFCGNCVDECPTGSLTDRWSKWYGVAESIDTGTCDFCAKQCEIKLKIKQNRLIGTSAVALTKEKALCVNGRFVYTQFANAKNRLSHHAISKNNELIPVSFEESAQYISELLLASESLAIVVSDAAIPKAREYINALAKKFAVEIYYVERGSKKIDESLKTLIEEGKIDTCFVYGNYLDKTLSEKIKNLIIADYFATESQENAKAIFAAKMLDERENKYASPKNAEFFVNLVKKLCESFNIEPIPYVKPDTGNPHKRKYTHDLLPRYYYGHSLVDIVPDLSLLGFKTEESQAEVVSSEYEILENKILAPNFHALKIKAPEIAKHAKAGQFAILMATKKSERSPFTIIDCDKEEGSVRFIIEEVGRSSAELGALKAGEFLAHLSGPLGVPFDAEKYNEKSSVLLLGGCYGIGAIYPIAKVLKDKGVKVTAAIEASSNYLLYFKEELNAICDEVKIFTRDGSEGSKGGVSDMLKKDIPFDGIVAIGCVFMMKQCATKSKEIKAIKECALNPIMVDGTGMCGACRVSIGNETKFCCVDGPFFELDKVDFNELTARRNAYTILEVDSMPRHNHSKCYK